MKPLNAYIGHAGEPQDGAVLVFARTARDAKPVAHDAIRGWFDCAYTDVRVRRLRDNVPYLVTLADPAKFAAYIAHSVDDVPVCHDCETWGSPLNDFDCCARCQAERDAEAGNG